jgi:hypothetical protein
MLPKETNPQIFTLLQNKIFFTPTNNMHMEKISLCADLLAFWLDLSKVSDIEPSMVTHCLPGGAVVHAKQHNLMCNLTRCAGSVLLCEHQRKEQRCLDRAVHTKVVPFV